MSDEQLDKEWKPTGRPQSTLARNFSTALDDLFKLNGDVVDLSSTVEEKKHNVDKGTQELQALEARLKEAEERLKKAAKNPEMLRPSRKNSQRRSPIQGTFPEEARSPTSPLAQESSASSEDSEYKPDMAGALPETPQALSGSEYVMVDRPKNGQPADTR